MLLQTHLYVDGFGYHRSEGLRFYDPAEAYPKSLRLGPDTVRNFRERVYPTAKSCYDTIRANQAEGIDPGVFRVDPSSSYFDRGDSTAKETLFRFNRSGLRDLRPKEIRFKQLVDPSKNQDRLDAVVTENSIGRPACQRVHFARMESDVLINSGRKLVADINAWRAIIASSRQSVQPNNAELVAIISGLLDEMPALHFGADVVFSTDYAGTTLTDKFDISSSTGGQLDGILNETAWQDAVDNVANKLDIGKSFEITKRMRVNLPALEEGGAAIPSWLIGRFNGERDMTTGQWLFSVALLHTLAHDATVSVLPSPLVGDVFVAMSEAIEKEAWGVVGLAS